MHFIIEFGYKIAFTSLQFVYDNHLEAHMGCHHTFYRVVILNVWHPHFQLLLAWILGESLHSLNVFVDYPVIAGYLNLQMTS